MIPLEEAIRRKTSLYDIYKIRKSKGGFRTIAEPRPELIFWQRLAKEFLDGFPMHSAAHGFLPGRSPVTNALPHRGSRWVLNMDIKDFFPSTSARSCFVALVGAIGSEGIVGRVPFLLEGVRTCLGAAIDGRDVYTYARVAEVVVDLCTLRGALPQGACTSPSFSNLVVSDTLDPYLENLASTHGLVYTRYADDLTFSGEEIPAEFESWVERRANEQGYRINLKKTKRMPWYQRQLVTGIVVNNDILGISKKLRSQIWQKLYQIGVEGREIDSETRGMVEHVRMVNGRQAAKLMEGYERGRGVRNQPSTEQDRVADEGGRLRQPG